MIKNNPVARPCRAGREIIRVSNLHVAVPGKEKDQVLLHNVDFSLEQGEIHGLVGESGCGKSIFARTLVRLEAPARIVAGSILIGGTDVAKKEGPKLFRGKKISLVLQNPAAAMDPMFTMASQFRDALSILPQKGRPGLASNSRAGSKADSKSMDRVYHLLEEVGITAAASRCRQYPHEWSRGMLQRAQLVMALLSSPDSIILDEVTSALDPTIVLQLLELITRFRQSRQTAFILITHDLAMAAHVCDRISVMRQGTILETQDVGALFACPRHAYTKAFIAGTGIGKEEG